MIRNAVVLSIPVLLTLAFVACGPPSEPPSAPPSEPPSAPPSETPPRSDTITAISQFLACSGNPYALCYYSGPETAPKTTLPALPCKLGEDGRFAACKCYAFEEGTSRTNYVALPSILNPDVRRATEEACGEDGKRCLNMANERHCADNPDSEECQSAPVCGYLGNVEAGTGQTLDPNATLVSTFSFEHAGRYPIGSTPCEKGLYAGCMTAGCREAYSEDGQRFTDCSCPTFDGTFQVGQSIPASDCDLGDPNVWSAADMTASISLPDASGGQN